MTMKTKAVKLISRIMAVILAFSACQQGLLLTAYAESELTFTPRIKENVDVEVSGSQIAVTDTNENGDVWNSKVMLEANQRLVPGKEYKISFDLSGDRHVGEVFLCKTQNMDNRYDGTFTNDDGNRTFTFTATSESLYIGMQVGNVGEDNTVRLNVTDFGERENSENPSVLMSANCDVKMVDGEITATDNNDNNDVWNSKLLYDAGVELIPGRMYQVNFSLLGDNGVGEFFLCKSQDLGNRYDCTFANRAGYATAIFTAETERMYVGMQFGNIGKGNSISHKINRILDYTPYEEPPHVITDITTDENDNLIIKATDTNSNGDVWDSKFLYEINQDLEPGKWYEIDLNLDADSSTGEFFLCKSANGDRYDSTFTNYVGRHTMVFQAEGPRAYVGMQMGNIGKGNSVTATIAPLAETSVQLVDNVIFDMNHEQEKTIITAEDTSDLKEPDGNEGVWTSKLVYSIDQELVAGQWYAIDLDLIGDAASVGEFFLCKSRDLSGRYDTTFTNFAGRHTMVFKAEGDHAYVGMQMGDIGKGNTVTATVAPLTETPVHLVERAIFDTNHEVVYENDGTTVKQEKTTITMTDTSDEKENGEEKVWTSKLLYYFGQILEAGKKYIAKINMASTSDAMGEFYFLKSDNLDDRYTFDNTAGDHIVQFEAVGTELYAGVQFGNIGKDNTLTVAIDDVFERPFTNTAGRGYTDICTSRDSVTMTVDSDEEKVWESQVVYDTGIQLEENQEYIITFKVDANNKTGAEFFLQKSGDEVKKDFYLKADNTNAEYYVNEYFDQGKIYSETIKGEGNNLFLAMQFGNLGKGNSLTFSDFTVTRKSDNSRVLPAGAANSAANISLLSMEETASMMAVSPEGEQEEAVLANNGETPIEEITVEETPTEETPVEETPVEETPTVETLVEVVPAAE